MIRKQREGPKKVRKNGREENLQKERESKIIKRK